MANAVLVNDMLRGFLEEGHPLYGGMAVRRIIPNVQRLIRDELSKGSKILFVCDTHAPDDAEFEMFPPHCIAGTEESEIIPELADFEGERIPKTRYSGFFESALDEKLHQFAPEKLIICGVYTNICILHTVADARNRNYIVEVPEDCVASMDEHAHSLALEHMEKILGARVLRAPAPEVPKPKFDIPESVLSGETADIYFVRTREILEKENLNPVATMEVFPGHDGLLCGMNEALTLLEKVLPSENREVWALSEGDRFQKKEVVLRITAPYQSYAMYETAYLGMLSHCSGWATAARECVEAAEGIPVISFGARHVHPAVVGRMEYAAIVGGCVGCASPVGAELAGQNAIGTIPHALILVMGETARATLAFDKYMPESVSRVALVDTLKDEPEESVNVAQAMGGKLEAVRLDTPPERGRVTPDLVKETRARLDLAGFKDVKIFVSGGVSQEQIRNLIEAGAPVDTFAVGSAISNAKPIDFTADIHEVEGEPIAKRGRIPGITPNSRLKRVL
ncbi:MAG: nicotinate phosphoribosyltransferase [Dehalococcoidia bacterium]